MALVTAVVEKRLPSSTRMLMLDFAYRVRSDPVDRTAVHPYRRRVIHLLSPTYTKGDPVSKGIDTMHTWLQNHAMYMVGSLATGIPSDITSMRARLGNKSYARMVEKLRNGSQLGSALALAGESWSMVSSRAYQLYRAYRALKRGRFAEFRRWLRVRPLEKHQHTRWTKPKDASAIWLEYWMGWGPLLSDISTSVEVLQSQWTTDGVVLEGKSSEKTKFEYVTYYSGQPTVSITVEGRLRMVQGCRVRVVNPNLFLANQLGFVNLAYVAYDMTPWSWFLNWFIPIENFIQSWTDFAGLEVSDRYATYFYKARGSHLRQTSWVGGSFAHAIERSVLLSAMQRDTSLIKPALTLQIPGRLAMTRAATSISLLVSMFTKG